MSANRLAKASRNVLRESPAKYRVLVGLCMGGTLSHVIEQRHDAEIHDIQLDVQNVC
jgi:hypothetical protein